MDEFEEYMLALIEWHESWAERHRKRLLGYRCAKEYCGVEESGRPRLFHMQETVGSNPTPASKPKKIRKPRKAPNGKRSIDHC